MITPADLFLEAPAAFFFVFLFLPPFFAECSPCGLLLLIFPGILQYAGGEGRQGLRPSRHRIQFTFPKDNHFPSERLKPCLDGGIPPDVALNLVLPELPVGLGQDEMPAPAVSVPEASVHKDYCMVFF